MINELFELGTARGLSIFFFLFVLLAAGFWLFIRSVMKENNNREGRYISTIDKLADSLGNVETVNQNIAELRKDIQRQESMIGRVLDRLPVKRE